MTTLLALLMMGGATLAYIYSKNAAPAPEPAESPGDDWIGEAASTPTENAPSLNILYKTLSDLPDVDPANQGGDYDNQYDEYFVSAKNRTGVPFALLKAHAIRESSLQPNVYHADTALKGSYGLMQIEWWPQSNRFNKYGYSDDEIGDGSLLYEPTINCFIGASIIRDNMAWLKNLRDAINAYNTGTTEAKHPAPVHYVDDVVKYYNEILGTKLIS